MKRSALTSLRASRAKEVLAVEVVGLQSMQDYQRKRSFLIAGTQGEEAAMYIERQRKCVIEELVSL